MRSRIRCALLAGERSGQLIRSAVRCWPSGLPAKQPSPSRRRSGSLTAPKPEPSRPRPCLQLDGTLSPSSLACTPLDTHPSCPLPFAAIDISPALPPVCLLTTPQSPPADAAARHFFFLTYFSNYFSRTTFLDYYLLYYSINNTSSTVGHGPAAISLLEGSSEPAVNSVAPLSLTPGSRAAECHAPSRADAVLSSPLTARASAVRSAIGPSRVMGRAEGWESVRGIECNPAPLLF